MVDRWLANDRLVRVSALLGAVAIAFSSILVRLSHASPSTAAIFRCAYALPILGALAWLEDRRFGGRSWVDRRIGIAAGVFFAADLILWHHSIDDVGAGLATVLANIQVVLVPLVAWAVLAERPNRRVLSALPIALVGVLLISGVLEQHGAYGRAPGRGAAFGLAAGIAYVGFLLLLRRSNSDLRRVAGPLFDATATAAVVAIVAGVIIGDADLTPAWPGVGWLIVLALTSASDRLAADHDVAAAPARGDHFADAHRPAGWRGGTRRVDPRRGPELPPARRRAARALRPVGRNAGRARPSGKGPPLPGGSSPPHRARPRR